MKNGHVPVIKLDVDMMHKSTYTDVNMIHSYVGTTHLYVLIHMWYGSFICDVTHSHLICKHIVAMKNGHVHFTKLSSAHKTFCTVSILFCGRGCRSHGVLDIMCIGLYLFVYVYIWLLWGHVPCVKTSIVDLTVGVNENDIYMHIHICL